MIEAKRLMFGQDVPKRQVCLVQTLGLEGNRNESNENKVLTKI